MNNTKQIIDSHNKLIFKSSQCTDHTNTTSKVTKDCNCRQDCLPSKWTLSVNFSNLPSLSNTERQQQNKNLHRTNSEWIRSNIQTSSCNISPQHGQKLHQNEQARLDSPSTSSLPEHFLDVVHQDILARDVYDRGQATGSQWLQMYGLPKTHKETIQIRPILSMIGSSQHELATCLPEILVLVLKIYSSHCAKIPLCCLTLSKTVILNLPNHFYALHISSLFATIPLDETIEICADVLYRGQLDCPPFPEDTFRESTLIATRGV